MLKIFNKLLLILFSGTTSLINAQITATYVVIGGGGGAGAATAWDAGGGGGTGGVVITGSISLNVGTNYTVTVGAGGGYQADGNSSSLSGSGITTITASGGSRGGDASGTTGGSGGTSNGTSYGLGGRGMNDQSSNPNCANGGSGVYINSMIFSWNTTGYHGGGGGGGNYNGVQSWRQCSNGSGSTNSGTVNTFGGGGRGQNANSSITGRGAYGNGNNGVVVIVYASSSVLISGGDTITSFVGDGTTGTQGVTYQRHMFVSNSNLTPLPIDLVSFNATPNNNTVDLTWTTFGDNKNLFNILKSTDGIKWNSIGTLLPTDNNVHYLFTDYKPAAVNYYQLSQLDHSNTLQYSDIRVVNFNGNTLSVFPNPNNGEFTIQSKHVVQFQISDFTGKVIMEGDNANPLIKTNFAKGIYFIQITEGDKTTFSKMIVQ